MKILTNEQNKLEFTVTDLESEKQKDVLIGLINNYLINRQIKGYQGNRLMMLDISAISYFQTENKLTYGYIEGNRYRIEKKMAEIEKLVGMIRISKQQIVNIDFIDYFKPEKNGRHKIYLKDGSVLTLSRLYYKSVITRLGGNDE